MRDCLRMCVARGHLKESQPPHRANVFECLCLVVKVHLFNSHLLICMHWGDGWGRGGLGQGGSLTKYLSMQANAV